MRARRPLSLALFLSAAFLQSRESEAAPADKPPPVVPITVVDGNTKFAEELYAKLAVEDGNVFFSPASISTALAMTWAGAKGETAKQMAKTMHFDLPAAQHHAAFGALLTRLESSGPDVPQLAIANRIWSQKGMVVEPAFLAITRDRYEAPLDPLSFAEAPGPARKTINDWVAKKTHEKIVDLLPEGSITDATRMVLTNAIWFKGSWATAFDKKLTKDESFATPTGKKNVPMMHATLHARYADVGGTQVLELPYKSKDSDRAMSMVVVLPPAKAGAKVQVPLALGTWTSALSTYEVDLSLPRFKTTKTVGLAKTLTDMGMVDAFDASKADFSGIAGKKGDLAISAVIHKAFVDVNEEGTEAAAATAVVVGTESTSVKLPPPKAVFRADRGFLFYIRDAKTGSVLFLGRVTDPTA